ncbi:MAG: patatin [Limnobacter sp. CACIAM 66H1]|uniref:patatin-like phospholipase family protein n=1 Tax=Limnobacter sp. CACIAM 66H1 TaxID=1813033 RepID=UPI0007A88148|nr:patatin-like phospholipase family protein [Limnobacter sp. CACIAM 66H1]KYP10918.1 MAG: patatin [Limnobacter sp. CACIAM 66H1]
MKRILSIDGGGIRGLIPALILAEIEQKTGKAISASFDLMAGTSTGAIIALGISKDDGNGKPQYSARDLAEIYQSRGKEIFSRSLWKGVSSVGGLTDELYSHKGLDRVLDEYFGDAPIGSGLTKTLITSYDIHRREPVFFKSWREEYRSVLMKHAARATSAAPTYFEPALIPIGGVDRALIDGGVFMNSPSVSAYAEAKKIFGDSEEFFILSIGTGQLIRPISFSEAKDWGKAGWLAPLLSCMFDGVSDAANYQMNMFLGDRYVRLQTDLTSASDDMDNATNGNIENLKAEAKKMIRTHKTEIDSACRFITAS